MKLGFVPLTDAAALIAGVAKGFFAEAGLDVELSREVSWATVRDKVAVGALDGAHLLAPLALAQGGLTAPFVLNRGGAAVTLSARIANRDDPAGGLRRLVGRRREQGSSPLTFAVVFPQSTHTFLLRRWLADAQLDPDRDVRITVAPPGRMAELLADGVIEGFCAGEPWSAAAEASGAGHVAVRASHVWPMAPDKVLALGPAVDAAEAVALVRALKRSAAWAADRAKRRELLEILASPDFVGVPEALLAAGLADIRLAGDEVNAPQAADAVWLVSQMARAGQLEPRDDAAANARRTFRPDLYDQA